MKTDLLLHRLKPDGYKDATVVTSMRHLLNEVQELADAAYAAIAAPEMPAGHYYLEEWREHKDLHLEVFRAGSKVKLYGFRVRGVDVTQYMKDSLWEEARDYCERCLGDETPAETQRATVRMDRTDLQAARAA